MPLGKVLTLNCREASRLSSDALDRRLATREAVAVRLHRGMCVSCRRFAGQMRALDVALKRAGDFPPVPAEEPPETLPDPARERIRRRLTRDA